MIIGRFYLRLTTSGNLIGEFSNNTSKTNSTESADRQGVDPKCFVGQFYSTWREESVPDSAELTIEPKKGTVNIFTLKWMVGDNPKFFGEGFLAEGLLIGDYHSAG